MIVAGIGCRKGASAEAVSAAVTAAAARCGLAPGAIDALATANEKSGEPGIAAAAEALATPLVLVALADMQTVAAAALTSSVRVMELKGVPSVAATAALAAAGRGAKLLGPRVATDSVTCAIAQGDGP
jgi:cobalt-precorrin 5A hydrolase